MRTSLTSLNVSVDKATQQCVSPQTHSCRGSGTTQNSRQSEHFVRTQYWTDRTACILHPNKWLQCYCYQWYCSQFQAAWALCEDPSRVNGTSTSGTTQALCEDQARTNGINTSGTSGTARALCEDPAKTNGTGTIGTAHNSKQHGHFVRTQRGQMASVPVVLVVLHGHFLRTQRGQTVLAPSILLTIPSSTGTL